MSKFVLLAVAMFFLFGNMNAQTTEVKDFDVSILSKQGQVAYQELIVAQNFEETHIGYAAAFSNLVKDFGILLKEKNADAAFKSMLKNGTIPAKLYALSGIYYTDYEQFQKEIENFKDNDETVSVFSGCEIFEEKVSKIVVSNGENVAIIKPTETMKDFWARNKTTYYLDIAHGGYSATFKHFAEEYQKQTK